MSEVQFTRLSPGDREALYHLIAEEEGSAAGIVIRLAWQLGFTRSEIFHLTCGAFNANCTLVQVGGRPIPIDPFTSCFFYACVQGRPASSPVLVSRKTKRPITEPSISRLAAAALTQAGLSHIKLRDLRCDFILTSLVQYPLDYVSHITGLLYQTLQTVYLPLTESSAAPTIHSQAKPPLSFVTQRTGELDTLLQAIEDPVVKGILYLVFETGISNSDLAALTWDQVDLERGVLLPAAGPVPIPGALRDWFAAQGARCKGGGPVFPSPRAQRPLPPSRISKLARAALIRYGFPVATLQQLRQYGGAMRKEQRKAALKALISEYLTEHERISHAAALTLTDVNPSAAAELLSDLVTEQVLLRYGNYYYRFSTEHWGYQYPEKILRYISRHPNCSTVEIEQQLHAPYRSAFWVLSKLLRDGRVLRVKDAYLMAQAGET